MPNWSDVFFADPSRIMPTAFPISLKEPQPVTASLPFSVNTFSVNFPSGVTTLWLLSLWASSKVLIQAAISLLSLSSLSCLPCIASYNLILASFLTRMPAGYFLFFGPTRVGSVATNSISGDQAVFWWLAYMSITRSPRLAFINQSFCGDSAANTPADCFLVRPYLIANMVVILFAPSYHFLLRSRVLAGTWSCNQSRLSFSCAIKLVATCSGVSSIPWGTYPSYNLILAVFFASVTGSARSVSAPTKRSVFNPSSVALTPPGILVDTPPSAKEKRILVGTAGATSISSNTATTLPNCLLLT